MQGRRLRIVAVEILDRVKYRYLVLLYIVLVFLLNNRVVFPDTGSLVPRPWESLGEFRSLVFNLSLIDIVFYHMLFVALTLMAYRLGRVLGRKGFKVSKLSAPGIGLSYLWVIILCLPLIIIDIGVYKGSPEDVENYLKYSLKILAYTRFIIMPAVLAMLPPIEIWGLRRFYRKQGSGNMIITFLVILVAVQLVGIAADILDSLNSWILSSLGIDRTYMYAYVRTWPPGLVEYVNTHVSMGMHPPMGIVTWGELLGQAVLVWLLPFISVRMSLNTELTEKEKKYVYGF